MTIRESGLRAFRNRAQAEIDAGSIPSCQYAFALEGEVVATETLGDAVPESRYIIFSATKPLTASVMWQLIAEGAIDPSATVSTYWPGFVGDGKEFVTVEHVMLHTAGFPLAPLDMTATVDRAARVAAMEAWRTDWEPGTRFEYHALSAHWVLAELITIVAGVDHCAALRRRVLEPLGLDRLQLGVPVEEQGDIRPFVLQLDRPTKDEVKDLFGFELDLPTGVADDGTHELEFLEDAEILAVGVPGAGAVSTAADLATFYQHVLLDPVGVWDPLVLADARSNVRNMMRNMLGIRAWRTLGLETAGDDKQSRWRLGMGHTSPKAFGHGGAFGQIAWADPATGMSFVFLTNGLDTNFVRENIRSNDLNRLAVACAG